MLRIILFSFFITLLLPFRPSAQQVIVVDMTETIKYNEKRLADYESIQTHEVYLAEWAKVRESWAKQRSELLNWPIASELSQIETVDMFYSFLSNNAYDIKIRNTGKRDSIKRNADLFCKMILRTNWSIVINREAYSFYLLLDYIRDKF